ncbi:hypothetical protein AUP68_17356 [Ilyonectria robusta]
MPALNNEDRGHTRHPASRLEAEKREAGDGANPKTTLMVRGTRQRGVLDKWRSPLEERQPNRLVSLPAELRIAIVSYLPNRDIKSLRRTCKLFGESVLLHIDRVFLSANPIDIRVLRAIAKHETYRHGVVELIWDDARLDVPPDPPAYDNFRDIETFQKSWYEELCESNVMEAEHRKGSDVNRPDHAARDRWIAAQPSTETARRFHNKPRCLRSEVCTGTIPFTTEDYHAPPPFR